MSSSLLIFSLLELLIAAAALAVACVAWRYRDRPCGVPLFAMAAVAVVYAITSVLESFATDPLTWRVLANFEHVLTAVLAVGSFYLAVAFTRREEYRRPVVEVSLGGFLAASFLVSVTDPVHGLMVTGWSVTPAGTFLQTNGPLFWVHTIVALGVISASVVLLAVEFTDARGVYRRQIAAIVVAFLFGIAFFLWEAMAPIHPTFDLATAGILGWCVITLGGVVGADFLETAPVARRTLMESMNDAVLALDASDRVIDVNPRACEEFGVEEDDVGTPVEAVLADYPSLLEAIDVRDGEREVALSVDDQDRFFHVKVSPVYDGRGPTDTNGRSLVGRTVVIRDVTEQKRRERELQRVRDRLEEQRDTLELVSGVARHDIRNDLQLVKSYAELLEDHVDGEGREFLTVIRENTEDAIELTTTARELSETVLQTEVSAGGVPLDAHLEAQLDAVRSKHPEATVTVAGALPGVEVVGTDMLGSVFRNLLENAVRHNDEDVPEVTVSVADGEETVEVRVADNGPGIPEDLRTEIFRKGEKSLESDGTGLGLYLVRTLVESYGGDVRVEDNDPKGAVFVVELPRAD